MRSLTRIYPIITQSGFYNDTGSRYMWPFHWNTQPRITASPSTRTYQYIMFAFIEEFTVQFLYFVGNRRIVSSIITLGLHINQVVDIFHNTMSQRIETLQYYFFVRNKIQVFRQISLHIHHWPNLQQIEYSTLVLGIQSYGKFNFNGTGHLTLTIFLSQLENL